MSLYRKAMGPEEGSEPLAHTSLSLKELGGSLYFSDDNMLLRDEYLIARDFLILRAEKREEAGVVVSGQSGIGTHGVIRRICDEAARRGSDV